MKLQDYLHYYYNGQCLEAIKVPGQELRFDTAMVTTRTLFNVQAGLSEVKLVLRRLEDMTEDEMIELFQSMVPDDMEDKPANDEFAVNVFRGDGGNLVDENVAIGAEYSCRCFEGQLTIKKCGTICAYDEAGDEEELVNAPRAYHYLLQQSFDLFGLIDAGLAIDLKTLNP